MKTSYLWILSAALVFAACGTDKPKNDDNELSRLKYTAEHNKVNIIPLTRQTFQKELISNGRLNAKHKSVIAFRTQGVINEIRVSNGSAVTAGDILAQLDKTSSENSLHSARIAMDKARLDVNDAVVGYGYNIADTTNLPADIFANIKIRTGYNSALNSLENAEQTLLDCTLRAPFSGKVANLQSRPYEQTKTEFCTIIDDRTLYVDFPILETELDMVRPGQTVQIAPFIDPQRLIDGRILDINPTVEENGQIAVRAEVPNDGTLLDGMNVKIYIKHDVPDQLVVPKSAVVIRDNLEVLFRYSQGKALWTYVHTIMDNSRYYVIKANTERNAELNVGDSIIISGNLNLGDGSTVELNNEE